MVTSCNKEELKYPRKYVSNSIIDVKYRAFQNNLEVTDTSRISGLFDLLGYGMMNLDTFDIQKQIFITKVNSDQAEIENKLNGQYKQYNIILKNNTTYFEEINDSVSHNTFLYRSNLGTYNPLNILYETLPIPPNMYGSQITYKPCYYINDHKDYLLMPMLDYYFSVDYPINNTSNYNEYMINNSFNEDFLSKENGFYTLLVREYFIRFELI
ncbi:hypothetical protein [Carboxylicivirga linearis]|uniref:Lipoprotein n=1 Tax=Carboxylicivirga linearis TaxID=1628157 RepID=A0ABS5JQV8_9BACT|nr:hypothetical protein [Carboxylicivirga linearis]MBS2096791.1 hypothetical protein [Carboxylicivirga linearis]